MKNLYKKQLATEYMRQYRQKDTYHRKCWRAKERLKAMRLGVKARRLTYKVIIL